MAKKKDHNENNEYNKPTEKTTSNSWKPDMLGESGKDGRGSEISYNNNKSSHKKASEIRDRLNEGLKSGNDIPIEKFQSKNAKLYI